MSTFQNSPRLVKDGLVVRDPDVATARTIIVLRFNNEAYMRGFHGQMAEGRVA